MEKQILEELYGKLRELIPDFETREEGNKNYISYKMQINDKDFETSVVITNGRAVAITGKRTYIYQIKEKSCEQFNNEVQTRYPLFQIYGGNGNISVGRRLLFDSVDELVTNIREFNSVCKAVIPQFEGSCVNFLVKTREEETYDPTQTFTPLEEESSNEKNADYVDSFVKDQQEYCKKTFYELAEGTEPVTKGNDVSFIRNEGDGSLKVTMDKNAPEDLKLDYAYVVDDQELAYIAIANITSTYKELEAFYNEKKRMLHVYSYVTPDKYLPDEPKEGIELLKEAIHNSLETAKKSTVSGEQVSANMQVLMNEQLEEIRLKTEELESSRTQIEEERGAFEKEKEAFLNEKNQMEAELEEERTKLQEKEAELEERENAIAEQESINDEEKAKEDQSSTEQCPGEEKTQTVLEKSHEEEKAQAAARKQEIKDMVSLYDDSNFFGENDIEDPYDGYDNADYAGYDDPEEPDYEDDVEEERSVCTPVNYHVDTTDSALTALAWFSEMVDRNGASEQEMAYVDTIVKMLAKFYFPHFVKQGYVDGKMRDTVKEIVDMMSGLV